MNLHEPFANGNTADIYRDGDKVIKVLKPHFPHSEIVYEADKQRWAYEVGLLVPKVIEVTTINERPALVMEYIAGETLGKKMLANKDSINDCLALSVDVQLQIHKIKPKAFESMSDKLHRQIQSAPFINERQKMMLLKDLDSMSYESKLCHGDFHVFNLLLANEDVVIIDWVDATSGDIRADVYRTYLLYLQHNPKLAESYLQLYIEKSGLTKDEIFQWAPFIAAARLAENVATESRERLLDIVDYYYPES